MDNRIKKNHSDSFKFKVAIAALMGQKTVIELSQEFCVTANQIYAWKKHLEENGTTIFSDKRKRKKTEENIEKLQAKVGQLTIENDFLENALNRLK